MTYNSEYWKDRGIDKHDWITEHWQTKNHPHRKQIVNILRKLQPWSSLLEIGCGSGANLYRIRKKFIGAELIGTDVNTDEIRFATKKMSENKYAIGAIEDIDIPKVDIILCDAVLLYVEPLNIQEVMKKITENARKAIILVEWLGKDKLGTVEEDHWARNYPELLKDYGWKTRMKKVIWPESEQWQKNGKIFVAQPIKK